MAFEKAWSIVKEKPDPNFTGLPCDECGESLNTHHPHLRSPQGKYRSGVCDKCKEKRGN